jgi:hypothetical protein
VRGMSQRKSAGLPPPRASRRNGVRARRTLKFAQGGANARRRHDVPVCRRLGLALAAPDGGTVASLATAFGLTPQPACGSSLPPREVLGQSSRRARRRRHRREHGSRSGSPRAVCQPPWPATRSRSPGGSSSASRAWWTMGTTKRFNGVISRPWLTDCRLCGPALPRARRSRRRVMRSPWRSVSGRP